MTDQHPHHIFFSYSPETYDFVEPLARRLRSDARLSFWFGPWHSVLGVPIQEQMEEALREAQACAVFISTGEVRGWQNEQVRTAIQTRVEDEPAYRIIPVLVPGAVRLHKQDLPPFLRRYEAVEFSGPDDEHAFKRLLAGILGIPPIQVEGYLEAEATKEHRSLPASGTFEHGHALVIGVANYQDVWPLPETVLNDARDLRALLTAAASCGYAPNKVTQLLDDEATGAGIRAALADLAVRTGPGDTVVVFFSGHGAHNPAGSEGQQYILPYDCDSADLPDTAIPGDEMTALLRDIKADRLLMLFDSCHSGGAGDPKGMLPQLKGGLSEGYYAALAQGRGRVVIASSRPDEFSWALPGRRNSLFTHYLLEALRGKTRTLGDGYVRVFDLFRHVADCVPTQADQHPIFKAAAMEEDFPLALVRRQ
ncbi:MAG: caspase family protein [Chloroflexi bacterium]|nr:caspase family protein [Chloroflexota bacterium]